ncbi:hypothetical protein AVL62_12700 [Serinicoccus chungangensis]|uniref:VOC domain-containing protein n=1 Tax=Serinicoccus chungangensis TaxID=767452 RepID=A0A0W8I0G3_9MICO|nr:VOC family protein [Serinicoccus chungangensis]KUG51101.1 hypothetical protein AVL62_12700 [Serinicoccus chungangensis]
MSTRESYAPGTPCWIDLMAPDVEAAKEFYTSLFGWTAQDSHDDDGTWIYTNFLHDGQVAAGLGRQPEEMSAAGMPPAWSTYVATGAVVSAWQPGSHRGAEVCNEPGTWSWNELMTRDLEAASAFYSAVFGWGYEDMPMPYGTYRVISGADEGGLGGLMAMPPNVPDEIPSYWTV